MNESADVDDAESARRGTWLRFALFNFLFVAAALGIYFLFYADARIDQANVRNFRALDAAAERLVDLVDNLPAIGANVPFGELSDADWAKVLPLSEEQVAATRAVFDGKGGEVVATRSEEQALLRIQRSYLEDLHATSDASDIGVEAFKKVDSGACEGRTTALRTLPQGMHLVITDCRPLSARNPGLGRAIAAGEEDGELASTLDGFGVRISIPLSSLVGRVATNVEPLFDQFLIADRSGRVLYSSDDLTFRYQDVTGAPVGRRVRLDFINQLNLAALVGTDSERASSKVEAAARNIAGANADTEGREWARYGMHSRLESVRIADMEFAVFVHPFRVRALSLPRAGPPVETAAETSADMFMVGVVSQEALDDEALKLRLSIVADALMLIGVLIASFSLLWLWTAGDRLVLATSQLLLFVATSLITAFLASLLALHVGSRAQDGAVFDEALREVGHRLSADFESELASRRKELETLAANMLDELPDSVDAGEGLERHYQCQPTTRWYHVEDARDAASLPSYEIAFLLDAEGRQIRCRNLRLFDTPPIDLAFRDYFQRPASGRLWGTGAATVAAAPAGGSVLQSGFFMERITSVVDGTTETVLAARLDRDAIPGPSEDDEPSVAVIIGPLASLERAVLPPHFRFAIVENKTGLTLFHSEGSRALATNFVRQVDGDAGLLALIDAGGKGGVRLDYHGTSVRAWVQPLGAGVPWTLVVYRGHELEDTLGIMAVSMTTLDVLGGWALVLLAFVALWAARGRARVIDMLVGWTRSAPAARDARKWLGSAAAGVTTMLVLERLTGDALAGFTGPVQPVSWWIGVASLFGTFVLLWWLARRRAKLPALSPASEANALTTSDEGASATAARVGAALLIALVTLLPTIGIFSAHRAELSNALGDYLGDGARSELAGACEAVRTEVRRLKPPFGGVATIDDSANWTGAFAHGWSFERVGAGPSGDAGPQQLPADLRDCVGFAEIAGRVATLETRTPSGPFLLRSPLTSSYGTMTAFSGLSQDLFARLVASEARPLPPASRRAKPARSPRDIMDELLGAHLDRGHGAKLAAMFPFVVGGLALVMLTIHSLVARILGVGTRLEHLAEARIRKLPSSWRSRDAAPLRALVVHRSDRLARVLEARFLEERFGSIERAQLVDDGVTWISGDDSQLPLRPSEPASVDVPRPPLYVVEKLELYLLRAEQRNALLAALEEKLDAGESLLICSRMLPGFWLSRMAEAVTGDVVTVSDLAAETTRWSHVLAPFDTRRLVDRREALVERFERQLEDVPDSVRSSASFRAVKPVMLSEALAHPELLELAAAVAAQVGRPDFVARGSRQQAAIRRFVAGAAGYFHELWAASTREERLQLYALSRGGYVNPMEVAVLSSLANRSLVSNDGLVRLRSRAFASFIDHDLVHDHLLAWKDQGHGNLWKSIWPPIALLVVLALAFFVSSTPEALAPLAALFAAGLGAVPILGGLMKNFRDLRPTGA